MANNKVDRIINRIYENRIESFNFKQSLEEGYYLKLDNDSIYLTSEEVTELLKKLHIKTDSILFKVFKLDLEKEAYFKRIISSIHDLGMLRHELTASNISKEELIAEVNFLKQLTKDKELASLDVEGMQQEELYNSVHKKHLEYYNKYKDLLLTEIISGS